MRIFDRERKSPGDKNLSVSLLIAALPLTFILGIMLGYQMWGKPVPQPEEQQADNSRQQVSIDEYDAVVSIACGVGVQFMAEKYHSKPIYPGVNTMFMGATEARGIWTERCQGCGQCMLAVTGGICPVSRCAKRIFNGPCGGSTTGKCEINKEVDCGWQLIVDRLKALGRLDDFETILPLKDWSTDRAGGPRKVVREDVEL